MNPAILSLATAVPPHVYPQDEIANNYLDIFSIPEKNREKIKKIFLSSSISKRHSVLDDFCHPRQGWNFWGPPTLKPFPDVRKKRFL